MSLPARIAKAPAPLVESSLATIEARLGGRDALVAALAHAPKSADLDYVLGLLGDPRRGTSSLAQLCAAGGITPGELIEAYKAGALNRAQALAIAKIGEHLPEVAEATMQGALAGGADIEDRRLAFDHKKLALDLGKLLPKSAGVNIAVQQNNQMGSAAGGALEAMQAATDAVLYGAAVPPSQPLEEPVEQEEVEAVEGEIAEEPEEPAMLEGDWRDEVFG